MSRDPVARARAEGFIAGFGMRPAFKKIEDMEAAWTEYAASRGVDPIEEPLFEEAFEVVAERLRRGGSR